MNLCTDESLGKLLHQYELGMLGDEDCKAFEIHLYECDSCLANVQELWKESRLLRHDPEARRIVVTAVKRAPGNYGSVVQEQEHKSPRRWKTLMPASMVAAAVLVLLILRPWQIDFKPADDAIAAEFRLVIMPFENIRDPDDQSRQGEVIANLLMTDLSESEFLQVVSPERLYDIRKLIQQGRQPSDSGELVVKMAEYAGARWILRGDIVMDRQNIAITSRLVEYPGLEVVAAQRVTGLADESIFSLIDRLTVEIKNDLSLPTAAFEEADPPVADITTHFPEAYLRFLEGVDFAQKMYQSKAAKAFEACLAIDSSYAMAYYHLAGLVNRSLINRAVEHIDRASQKDSYYIRSRAAAFGGDRVGNRKILEDLLERFPREKEALLLLGQDSYEKGDTRESIRYMAEVLKIDPLNKSACNQLAYYYSAIGDIDNAVRAINDYIRLVPNEANPYDSRGDLLARKGLLDEALESYQIALEKNPDFGASMENLGHMYLFQGKFDEATQQYENLIEGAEYPLLTRYNINLALVPLHQGRLDDALESLDKTIAEYRAAIRPETSQESASAQFLKFKIYLEKNMIEEAVREAESCIQLTELAHPGNGIYFRWPLAYSLALIGEQYRADSIIDALGEHYRQDPSNPIAYYWTTGLVALARQNLKTAVEMMEKGVERHAPASEFMGFCYLGHIYVEAGMYHEAISLLEPTVKVLSYDRLLDGVHGVKIHYYLGLAYEGAGEHELAVEQYTTFLNLWKNADPDLVSVADAKERLARLENTL